MKDIAQYKTWFFDCDGVLLDSNSLKSQGFYDVAVSFGAKQAQMLRDYHCQYGGISRYEKMRYFITDILKKDFDEQTHKKLVDAYGDYCFDKLKQSDETPSLLPMLEFASSVGNCYVVSGGKQDELRDIFAYKDLDKYFRGIYGSPDSKMDILAALIGNGEDGLPAVYVGDSRYDYIVAEEYGFDFIFMTQFTEFVDWQDFFADKDVKVINNFSNLLCNRS